jgi:peptidyl-prolyl cis-trans isomerase SurA
MKLASVIAAVGMLTGFEIQSAEPELVDGINAIVHDSIITIEQVRFLMYPVLDRLHSEYGGNPQELRKRIDVAENENLEQLIEKELILREFVVAGFTNALPDSAVDEELQSYIRSNYGGDRVRFIKTLQAEGKTLERFRAEYRDRIIVEQMRYSHESTEAIVSPHKIEVYYAGHPDAFKQEIEVKLRMIVLNKTAEDPEQSRKLAGEILAKINDGASFAEMASIYSQGAQRSQGGDWGWVEKTVLRRELADVAFSLKKGEKSGVIDTPEACYLMLVEDQHPEHIKPLNEVRNQIENLLTAQERDRLQKQWIARLKKKTFIRYF